MNRNVPCALQASRKTLNYAAVLTLLCFAFAVTSSAQAFKPLANFDYTNGYGPGAALVQGVDGNFYGTTGSGGERNSGVVFNVSPTGSLTVLQSLCGRTTCLTGTTPTSALVLTPGGYWFGVAGGGGVHSTGTIFQSTDGARFRSDYSFCSQINCSDGENPTGLIQGADGNLYGSTYNGGAFNFGEIFKVDLGISQDRHVLFSPPTLLHSFCAEPSCADGAAPAAPPIQAADGNFYGTTFSGGANGSGTVYQLTPAGVLTTLYAFCSQPSCADGGQPVARLVQASNGYFYGITTTGGANGSGTIFRITSAGVLTTLHNICEQGCTNGGPSNAELIQANDGNFYGVSQSGGIWNEGTLFKMSPGGALVVRHHFSLHSGGFPEGALVQGTDGKLYGTTAGGGLQVAACAPSSGCGSVFSYDLGLTPFVKTLGYWAKPGTTVVIYGTDLSGTTNVTFNGTPAASFDVVSATEVDATVPSGATSGKIQVVTPSGTLSTLSEFHIRP